MICTTIRNGQECMFMKTNGCSYNGGNCWPVVQACDGCKKAQEFETGVYCIAVPDPAVKWKNGSCNLSTHAKAVVEVKTQKINPIKASKRR